MAEFRTCSRMVSQKNMLNDSIKALLTYGVIEKNLLSASIKAQLLYSVTEIHVKIAPIQALLLYTAIHERIQTLHRKRCKAPGFRPCSRMVSQKKVLTAWIQALLHYGVIGKSERVPQCPAPVYFHTKIDLHVQSCTKLF